MQIGILTYYGVHNHGAVLQANGLKRVLQSLGHDVRFLTFERSYEYISSEQTKKYKIGLNSIPFYCNYMMQKGIGSIWFNFCKRNRLKQFRRDNFDLSVSVADFTGDITIIGSDEVFSLEIGYNPCMYGYGLKTKKVISYAGSFGPSTIEEIEDKGKYELVQKGLNLFDSISVRDQNSQSIIEKMCHKKVPLVCDPVLLYGYKEEMKQYTPPVKDYLLVYAYDNRMNDKQEIKEIIGYAHKFGLKVYSVGFYHPWCDKNIPASPIELLGWVHNATLVVTDTFHGSVLSIICNTPLAVKLRNNSNKLLYLLREYNLDSRIMETFNDLKAVAESSLDFTNCNQFLLEKRTQSLQFLKRALGD